MKFRLRNCPYCYLGPRIFKRGRCGFCNGKRKVNAYYFQWAENRAEYYDKIENQIQNKYEEIIKVEIADKMKEFNKKFPAPKKFAK